jgi:hypothetical protein
VWYFKGKDFLTYKAPGYLMGRADWPIDMIENDNNILCS